MKSIRTNAALLAASSAALLWAGSTKSWEHDAEADYRKGKLTRLALRSDGRLSLALAWRELHDASTSYLWAVAEDARNGNVYYGGSGQDGKAKLHVLETGKPSRVLAELNGLEIHALALDAQGRVYAATSPDGKVYRVTPGTGAAEEFYDPKSKYIWALAFNPKGELLVATGDKGELHRVTAAGQGSVLYRTEETHARSLTVDKEGNAIVGTEPGGLIVRVDAAGQGFVLHQTSKREVTAVAADAQGNIYAAAAGARTAGAGMQMMPLPAAAPPATPVPSGGKVAGSIVTPRPGPPSMPPASFGSPISGGSEIVQIEPDGFPRKVWSDDTDIIYSLAFDGAGSVLAGTGNRGNLVRIDQGAAPLSTLLLSAAPTQITALAAGRGGRVLAVTGNIGKLFALGPDVERDGVYESEALDAGFFTYWGRMNYTADLHGGAVKMETRSGNLDSPQRAWSAWAAVPLNSTYGRVGSPAARFLQYRVTLTAAGDGQSPDVAGVDIAYQQKNVAPVIEIIDLTPPNYKFAAAGTITLAAANSQTISLPALGRNAPKPVTLLSGSDAPSGSMNYAKGHMGARWLARDDNGDVLLGKVEIRGVNETAWKPLREDGRERHFSFDSTAFADGDYRLRVTVQDEPANPPAQVLTATLESSVFTIDNTPPVLAGLAGTRNGTRVEVKWKATDALSVIAKAEYSLNGGEWKTVEPTTRLTDSHEHEYVLSLDNAAAESTVAVRVTDYYDNQTVAKTVVR
ncbi:MAG: hypothetical protein FJW31_15460 [Acidobacteria bacterium]|nr:hypothetical protein [Acidobacteriota bacterium]